MKRFLIIATLFATSFTSFSQSLGYQDLALLFSQNDHNGSARFTAMSGAFGALGGDISSVNINPAGLSVNRNSAFSATLNSRDTDITTNYYNNKITTKNNFFNISHAGAILVFDTAYDSEWKKFAVGFNYRILKDFSNNFFAKGNSGYATFNEFPLDNNNPVIQYNNAEEQSFNNTYSGDISEFNFAFSAVHQNKLHIGAAFNTYDLKFSQRATLKERNNDGNGNTLKAQFYQENITTGTAFSLSAGFLYKAHKNFRFGASYQTPTWFTEILETSNITNNDGFDGNTQIEVSNGNTIYDNTAGNFYPSQEFIYKLKTPSKLTASAAFIFGKMGLISADYSIKNYQNLQLSNADFSVENQSFQNDLRNTYTVNVGTEWRLDRFSIRGGYRFEQSPYKNSSSSDNLEGYSYGAGYNFGNLKIDLSYSNSNKSGVYDFYPQFNQVNAAGLHIDNRVFTATVTLNL